MARKGGRRRELDRLERVRDEARELMSRNLVLGPLRSAVRGSFVLPADQAQASSVEVDADGTVAILVGRRATAAELAWLWGHALLHFGLEQFQDRPNPLAWHVACDLVVARFLLQFCPWPRVYGRSEDLDRWGGGEETLYEEFCLRGIPDRLLADGFGAGLALTPMAEVERWQRRWRSPPNWPELLGEGVRAAVTEAVGVAAGRIPERWSERRARTPAREAMEWFIASYPLLGGLAATYELIESADICQREAISVAAVCPDARELFVNPGYRLESAESRFVMAHELLHVGLCHAQRRRGRDPFLWNVACDYVINGWLVEMEIGTPPPGLLLDETLAGLSAEQIYDQLVTDLRRCRRLATFRGKGECDILERRPPDWWLCPEGIDLDTFCRRALSQGLQWHLERCRGLLPAGLVEEIRALEQPPIPWDVELAHWFDRQFPLPEQRRTYARPSRRQGATPDIPRPRYVDPAPQPNRTFGVLLDTSGSMDRVLLGKALGAIASYAVAREVPAARLICCDARAYDLGWVPPEQIADRIALRGRGGTVLQPGIDLLETAPDFPPAGPLLIITDAICDRLTIRREHAFLIPDGAALPFVPRGEVFRIR